MNTEPKPPLVLTGWKLALHLLLAVCLWFAAQGYFFFQSLDEPYHASTASQQVMIQRGLGARQIARELVFHGLVRSRWHFLAAAHVEGAATGLQAGEYDASRPLSPREWATRLQNGERMLHRVTIPDGWSIPQVDRRMVEAGLLEPGVFSEAAADPELLSRFEIDAPNAEGYLFPETYTFEKPVSARLAVETMLRQFQRESLALGGLKHEDVVLASILTKEAHREEDLVRASAVFHNRLQRNMQLESDATVVYALERQGLPSFPLDRTVESPYNTYARTGLPPFPICNPGREALRAAIHPAEGNWLFFLSDDDGQFYFYRTHQEHVRKKRDIRRARSGSNE